MLSKKEVRLLEALLAKQETFVRTKHRASQGIISE